MATSTLSRCSLYFCLLLLCHGSMAQLLSQGMNPWQSPRRGGFRGCRFDRLQPFEPLRRVRSEAGVTEYFEQTNEQFQCAGVSVVRRVIEPQGLLVPRYTNSPGLAYIIQGRGYVGLALSGCPETQQQQFQQYDQSQRQQYRDEHQKVHQFRQGDVVALPAGVAHWLYNQGDAAAVVVYVFDTHNNANQLEPRQKEFLLAGSSSRREQQGFEQPSQQQQPRQNIFSGFSAELLSEALGISREAARRVQSQSDQSGEIIRVRHGLQILKPSMAQREEQQERYQRVQYPRGPYNGLEESICAIKVRTNIDNPDRADAYNPRAGRITRINAHKFPVLNLVQMSAARVNLYQNAILSPFWNINAHSVVYMIQGQARVQVVSNQGRAVFNGQLRQGQLLIIPQNYAVIKKAERQGCQYVAFETNPNAMVSHIAGKNSILRAMPVDVIANAYRISREAARSLKNNRGEEVGAFAPRFPQESYGRPGYQSLVEETLSVIGL